MDSLFEPPDRPSPRRFDYPWMSRDEWLERHQRLLNVSEEARARSRLVFVGDSITEGWDERVWAERYAGYGALRFGIGGDKTHHVLWRIQQGELKGLQPAVVVLLIGTNNLGNDEPATPEALTRGIFAVVDAIRGELPKSEIVLLALLPREAQPDAPLRQLVTRTNALLATRRRTPSVRFVDIGDRFLDESGAISPTLMADYLHPTPEGYRVMAEALEPTLTPLLAT